MSLTHKMTSKTRTGSPIYSILDPNDLRNVCIIASGITSNVAGNLLGPVSRQIAIDALIIYKDIIDLMWNEKEREADIDKELDQAQPCDPRPVSKKSQSTLTHGANEHCPMVKSGHWAYCHGHPEET